MKPESCFEPRRLLLLALPCHRTRLRMQRSFPQGSTTGGANNEERETGTLDQTLQPGLDGGVGNVPAIPSREYIHFPGTGEGHHVCARLVGSSGSACALPAAFNRRGRGPPEAKRFQPAGQLSSRLVPFLP